MGYAFSYPTVRLFSPRISIGSYTHYPTISTDMLRRVQNRETGHTNNASVTSSWFKSNLKLGFVLIAFKMRNPFFQRASNHWTIDSLPFLLLYSPSSFFQILSTFLPTLFIFSTSSRHYDRKWFLDSSSYQ